MPLTDNNGQLCYLGYKASLWLAVWKQLGGSCCQVWRFELAVIYDLYMQTVWKVSFGW